MLTTTKPFLSLTAADLMSRDVVTVPAHASLPAAARMLSHAQISGAPVVDAGGVCVGVLSATDLMHSLEREGRATRACDCHATDYCADWQVAQLDQLPAHEVRDYMTPDPIVVPPNTGIGNLARMMLDAHIHRIIVVDAQKRPVGIVSSTDVLAAVAYAARAT
jgi:CBS-domain-containing membrane protein